MSAKTPTSAARHAGLSTLLVLALLQAGCGGGEPMAQPAAGPERAAAAAAPVALEATHEPEAGRAEPIEIDVRCCGAASVEEAVGIVWALQAAHDLPRSVPVLVRAEDLRLAAAAAQRLADGGLTHVWVLQP